ncbi:interaptin-like [Helianthus annuus]|uniref:interaptin-like n=1 Tax=Helianthus annuus TaxID=4232 RepID=UPI0016530100|nr:interaptin-like [Helianthus annuus]
MNNPSAQQDVKMYFKGGVQDVEASPKIQTAFSAENSSGSINQSPNSSSGISSYPNDEKVADGFSWDKYIPPDSKTVALIAQIVKEPDLLTEWMKVFDSNETSQEGESVSSDESSERTTVFYQSPSDSSSSDDSSENTIVFDQSPTDDSGDDGEERHINVAKIHLSPESFQFYFADRLEKLKDKRATKEKKMVKCDSVDQEKNSEQRVEKVVEVEKIIEVEKTVEVIKPCLKYLESCKQCEEKDEKLSEQDKMKEQLLFNLNYVKEWYDVLNRTVTGL